MKTNWCAAALGLAALCGAASLAGAEPLPKAPAPNARAAARGNESAASLLAEGKRLRDGGNLSGALEAWQKAAAIDPKLTEAWHLMAASYAAVAEQLARKAVETDPTYRPAQELLARLTGEAPKSVTPPAPAAPPATDPIRQSAAEKAKPGQIAGRAVDSRGRPLQNFTVHVAGVSLKSGNEVSVDTDFTGGRYAIQVGPGQFGAWASADVEYAGKKWRVNLHPDDGKEAGKRADTTRGLVKNFVWKTSGLTAGGDPEAKDSNAYVNYYGAHVTLSDPFWYGLNFNTNGGKRFADGSTLEVTLTPTGPLIDGSAGKPVVYRAKMPWTAAQQRAINDIPIGPYTVTAKLTEPDGAEKPLRVAAVSEKDGWHTGQPLPVPAASAPIRFEPRTDRLLTLFRHYGVDLYFVY